MAALPPRKILLDDPFHPLADRESGSGARQIAGRAAEIIPAEIELDVGNDTVGPTGHTSKTQFLVVIF